MKRILRWGAYCLLLATMFFLVFSHGMFIWTIDWNNPAPFMEGDVQTIEFVDGKLVANLRQHKIDYMALDDMPEHLVNAFVAVEDRRFYRHWGVDIRGVMRAIRANLHTGDIAEGGSTITQQLSRNLFLNLDQNMARKVAEMSIAFQLERRYTKDEILEMYINQVNFGVGNWGVVRAAQAYFGKDVADLTIGESALLAGLVQAPNSYAPVKSWDLAIARQRYVLSRMAEQGFISQEQAITEVYQVDN